MTRIADTTYWLHCDRCGDNEKEGSTKTTGWLFITANWIGIPVGNSTFHLCVKCRKAFEALFTESEQPDV